MILGIGLRQGPSGVRFLISEVPLYTLARAPPVEEYSGGAFAGANDAGLTFGSVNLKSWAQSNYIPKVERV